MSNATDGARISSLPVDPMFLDRWSPRSFGGGPLSQELVHTLFEASRWAPSARNQQPWMFVYADSEPGLARIRELLVEGNRLWAGKAPLLAILFARVRNDQGEENRWAPFDAGAAWMSLAIQARKLGLYSHAMGGFHDERACAALDMDPAQWKAMAAIAVGEKRELSALPAQLQEREKPSDRKMLSEVARRIG